jgi:outer membrane receptor for ferrienterochelin and colicins
MAGTVAAGAAVFSAGLRVARLGAGRGGAAGAAAFSAVLRVARLSAGRGHAVGAAVFIAVLLLAAPAVGVAQAGAPLSGRVVDAGSGAPVAGAEVRLSGPRMAVVLSGRDGVWRVDSVPPGEYRIRVTHPGFAARSVELLLPADPGALELTLRPRPVPLDAVVVTAARRAQQLAEAVVATELIPRREIEASGASDLAAVLIERTGIQLQGGHPTGAGVMLQGLGAERVLVLIDGQPFVGRIAGRIDLSRIPTALIERVEVVRGPQSTLYGSDAMGGVINVITRRPTGAGWGAGAEVTGGTRGRIDAAVRGTATMGPFASSLDLGRRTVSLTPGVASGSGALTERWDVLAGTRWAPDTSASIAASVLLLDERQRWGSGQLFRFVDNRQWSARLAGEWTLGRHRLQPALYLTEFHNLFRRALAPRPVAGTGQREVQRLWEVETLYGVSIGRFEVDGGVELRREAIASARVAGRDRTSHTVEPFVQTTWTAGALSLVPGARLSWSEQWGMHWTPRLAALLRPHHGVALRASFGRGYRAPSFKELHMEHLNHTATLVYAVRGNPDLQPESSTNFSAGAEWVGDRLYLRGQLFDNRFERFIETRLAGDSGGVVLFTYGNVQDGTTRGLEVETGATWGGFRVEGGYGYLHAVLRDTGLPLLGRPAHSGRLSITHELRSGLRAGLSGVYTGRTPVRRTAGEMLERPGFLRFDFRIAHSLPHDLDVAIGVDNVLDTRPGHWPGYAGRHLYLRLGWRGAVPPGRAGSYNHDHNTNTRDTTR